MHYKQSLKMIFLNATMLFYFLISIKKPMSPRPYHFDYQRGITFKVVQAYSLHPYTNEQNIILVWLGPKSYTGSWVSFSLQILKYY